MRLWLFLVGAGLGAIVGLTGCIASSDADWLVAIPMCGILLAVQPLNVIWFRGASGRPLNSPLREIRGPTR